MSALQDFSTTEVSSRKREKNKLLAPQQHNGMTFSIMKFTTRSCSLLLALFMLVSHSAWSQCLLYNSTFSGSSSGQNTLSGTTKGFTIVGPQQIMQDGLTRSAYVSFETYTYKFKTNRVTQTIKEFYYYNNPLADGTPSSGGLIVGLVKQGRVYKVLATFKDVFDSDTVSGTATFKNLLGYGPTYYASTLSGGRSGWEPEDDNDARPIGDPSSTINPVKVYKYTSTVTYVLNTTETAIVANKTYNEALDWKKQNLISQGFRDRIASP